MDVGYRSIDTASACCNRDRVGPSLAESGLSRQKFFRYLDLQRFAQVKSAVSRIKAHMFQPNPPLRSP